jgi:hypothetical protein
LRSCQHYWTPSVHFPLSTEFLAHSQGKDVVRIGETSSVAPLTLDRSLAVLGSLKAIGIAEGYGWPVSQTIWK